MPDNKKNICRRACAPCAVCCRPVAEQCDLGPAAALDFRLDGQMWKTSFGKPSGLGASCMTSPVAFLAVRVGLLLFWFSIMLWSMADWVDSSSYQPIDRSNTTLVCAADGSTAGCALVQYKFGYWFTQLTHWTLLFELVYLGFAASTTYLAVYSSSIPDGTGDDTPWFVSVTWAMQPAALVASCMVFVLYWALLYSPGDAIHAISVMTHGGNFLVMLIDFLICRQPFYLAHITMPIAYSLAYLTFSLLYYAGDGKYHRDEHSPYIYDVLDWSDPSGPGRLSAIIILIVVPFLYVIFIACYTCRARCNGAPRSTHPIEQEVAQTV